MAVPAQNPEQNKAIAIVEELVTLGLPNKKSIRAMEVELEKLKDLSPHLEHINQISIKEIDLLIQKFKKFLVKEKEIPLEWYNTFNAKLEILKTNLYP